MGQVFGLTKRSDGSRHVMMAGLLLVWLLALFGAPVHLPLHVASWLVFIALLITPGYFLAEIITWRLRLDGLERLALALPLGMAILALPGIVALVQHWTITGLAAGWSITSALVILVGLLYRLWTLRPDPDNGQNVPLPANPWTGSEIFLLLLVVAGFIAIVPILSLYKIDGDAYAVGSFAADALAGLPLNATEPLFGTDLGPGVRMVFNQSLPMVYLWSYLSGIDPITLTATASRAMIALWALLASYTLGKAAGAGSRRLGLLTASIQLLIYLAAPFIRGDNVSLFFFERINADKFMVPVTMLPVVFAFAIRYTRDGRLDTWLAAALATLAVSTIHPLVAAMLALALAAFGGFRLLLELGFRIVKKYSRTFMAWGDLWLIVGLPGWSSLKRTLALWGLVLVVMVLPLVQLVLSQSETPLAPSYPTSLEGWPIGKKLVPVLPLIYVPTLDLYGSLPTMAELKADQVNGPDNPFLIWRFGVNMERRRLILFDLDSYISDPALILEPPYLLALLLLPLLLLRIRSDVAAQFVVSTSLGVLFVMFNPLLTPLIGSLVMPWILWRMVWLLPYALIMALMLDWFCGGLAGLQQGLMYEHTPVGTSGRVSAKALLFMIGAVVLSLPLIMRNLQDLDDRAIAPYFYPAPRGILAHLNQATSQTGPAIVLADQDLSVTIPAFVANANVVAHRAPTTSEIFPADQQETALQRLIDQETFFGTPYLTSTSIEILRRYSVDYIITTSGSDLDLQLRLAPDWFEWVVNDQSYSLYRVSEVPALSKSIQGNTALLNREWTQAETLYQAALEQDSGDLLALLGLAEIAHSQGQFRLAEERLREAIARINLPILHYRLGQLYAERGFLEDSIAEFEQAQRQAPGVARFYIALGDSCLSAGREKCASEQYYAAVQSEDLPDEASRLLAEGELWQQRGRTDRAVTLYEQAVALRPNEYNQFVLEQAYREVGQFEQAASLIRKMRWQHPLSSEVTASMAALMGAQGKIDQAVFLYRQAIWLQEIQLQASTVTRLALAQLLLRADRLDAAGREISRALLYEPYNAEVYRLQGDLYRQQNQSQQAISAYQRAFQLDPTQVAAYVSLSEQMRQHGGQPVEIEDLLHAAIRLNPDEPTLLLTLGDQLQRLGDVPAAIDAYQAALEKLDPYSRSLRLNPQSIGQSRAFAYARLARVYEDMGQWEPAMDYYQATAAAAPDIPWAQVMLGDALRWRNKLDEAKAIYQKVIRQNPDYVDAYVRLAELLAATGLDGEANYVYDEALKVAVSQASRPQPAQDEQGQKPPGSALVSNPTLQSDETLGGAGSGSPNQAASGVGDPAHQLWQADQNVNTVRLLAQLYQRHNRTGEAIELFQRRIQQGVTEGWPPTLLAQFFKGLGDLYLAQHQRELATQAYQRAVALDNWWPEARLALAQTLREQGSVAEALHHLELAVSIAPGSAKAQVALAQALEQYGDADQALAIYQAVAQAHPGDAQATLAVAQAWRDRSRPDKARESYKDTIAMNPGAVDAYLGLAELGIEEGDYDEAETWLQQAITANQYNASIYIRLFELEQRRGNPERALAWYRQAVTIPSISQTIKSALMDALIRYGNYQLALTSLQEELERQPSDPELWLRQARILRALGRYTEATSMLEAKLSATNDSRFYAELAELKLAQGRPREALPLYERAVELKPDEAAYYLALSQVQASQGNFDQAQADLQQGQARVVHPAELYAASASLLLQRGQPELALQTFEQGLQAVGEDRDLLLGLGKYYESRSDSEQAEKSYTRLVEIEPEKATGHLALANLYLRLGSTEKALEQYNQAIALEPGNPGAYLALGSAYRRLGRLDEAVTAYSRVLNLAPTLLQAYTELADIYQEQERWDDARNLYEQGIQTLPASGQLLVEYAAFLLGRKEQEQAMVWLQRAGQVEPRAATLVARANIYAQSGYTAEALQDLKAALDLEPASVDAWLALGDLHRRQKKYNDAEKAYQQANSLTPGAAGPYLRLGDLANEQGNRAKAEQYAAAAQKAEPGLQSVGDN